MSEGEQKQTIPITFDVVEKYSTRSGKKTVYIGNTGGIVDWKEGDNYFEQHFTPDGNWDPVENPGSQRKYSTLYPAVLYEIISWQGNLAAQDDRKNINLLKGSTNKIMSDFRQKLLGDAYSFQVLDNKQNPSHPIYRYDIDINKIKGNRKLLKKLESYSRRAKKMQYTTITPVPKPGEIKFIQID